MDEKRRHPRFPCLLKVKFTIFNDGNQTSPEKPIRSKGRILDISKGGVFIASKLKTNINIPVSLRFRTRNKLIEIDGTIVRTGLIHNNPSDELKKIDKLTIKEEAYLAIEFTSPLAEFDSAELVLL